jgi:Ni,Fe-hydrogenase III large subunit
MAAYWFERYLHDMFGIIPDGHPDLRRLVHHENIPEGTHPLRKDFKWNTRLPVADVPYPMARVEGEGVFEIPVGPIHAGIIEPGHFRFSVAGERIITLEGKLFFTHKGVEKLIEGKTPEEALPYIERISGDMAAAHALAFCQAVESALHIEVSKSVRLTRSMLGELERMTMHIHDLANIGGMGTGFALLSSGGFRIKERLVRASETVFGNRFWRGAIIPGGVTVVPSKEQLQFLVTTAESTMNEMLGLVKIAFASEGFRDRLETTGVLTKEVAIDYGAVGLPARASGVKLDVRTQHPYAAYDEVVPDIKLRTDGDVGARYMVRVDELRESLRLLKQFVELLKDENKGHSSKQTRDTKTGMGLSAVESWRGEIMASVHLVDGKIERCVIRDPSFMNWPLFGELAPGNIIPDFPICNKSLNLSYSGTDM